MPLFRAAWLLPIAQPPIRDGWLRTDHGRILAFGHCRPGDLTAADEIDLGDVAVLPGLVNAHTHLELSWMRGRVAEGDDFPGWIRRVVALSRSSRPGADEIGRTVAEAIDEARRCGTAAVGDISNSLATSRALVDSGMGAVVFHELIGFRSDDAARIVRDALQRLQEQPASPTVRYALAPHAPYSVSAALVAGIRSALPPLPTGRSSIHLGESRAEIEFLSSGTGPWRSLLDDVGAWDASWVAPKCGPVDYVDRLGMLDGRVLLVHGVQFARQELERVAASGATLVTCPRGNIRTGAGTPPVAEFFESGVRVAVGTDSLASVPDLNVFAEIAEMRRLAPHLPARALLESATVNGAWALGVAADFGTIEVGKRDRLIAVELDGAASRAEEQLVSGIHPAQIRWLSW